MAAAFFSAPRCLVLLLAVLADHVVLAQSASVPPPRPHQVPEPAFPPEASPAPRADGWVPRQPADSSWAAPPAQLPASPPVAAPTAPPATEPAGPPPEYRPLARLAGESELAAPITGNVWVLDPVEFPEPPASAPAPLAEEFGLERLSCESFSDADHCGPFWSEPCRFQCFPPELLWEDPMANQREPRLAGKFTKLGGEQIIDTAIGAQFGAIRWSPPARRHEGIQFGGFAAVFSRFNQQRLLTAVDFRTGLLFSYAKGPWQAKLAYEHTSTHLGDEFIEAVGRRQVPHVRDEIVFGLARRFWDRVRLYGQYGFSFLTSDVVGDDRSRFDWGIEWSRQQATGWKGQPFAAFDMDLRSDQDFQPNLTFQIGWQWKEVDRRRSGRIALEVYNGRSPFGQFFRDFEDWIGVAFLYDW